MKPHRGFKMVESLIILAGLLVLVILLFPFFAQSRHTPGSCQSGLKQVSLGWLQYLGDNDGRFPYAAGDRSAARTCSLRYGWAGVLWPYLKSPEVFQCPQEPTKPSSNGCATLGPAWRDYTDYAFNARLGGKRQKNIIFPDKIVVLQDGASGNGRDHAEAEVLNTAATARHMEGNNFAFADGHVKWLKAGTVTQKYSFVSK